MTKPPRAPEIAYASVGELGAMLAERRVTSVELVESTLASVENLDRGEDGLRSVLSVDPGAMEIARERDVERESGRICGPLHGIPILVKDNIETSGVLGATAGSLALAGVAVENDAGCVALMRAAGAVIVGKTNLSEWANFRSRHSSSGWSAVGGQTRNPYALDRTPGGSSSGSAVAVAAGLVPLALGTETDGSIVCPASLNGVVGLKPTHGLVSTSGVVPLAASQDCVGPLARSVLDAAIALTVLTGAGADYITAASARSGLHGVRIGVARAHYTGSHPAADLLFEAALEAMRSVGATLVDPADVPTATELAGFSDELVVLLCELHDGLDRYLSVRDGGRGESPRSVAELVAFDEEHASDELAVFGHDLLVDATAAAPLDSATYLEAFERNRTRARVRGLDRAFAVAGADVLVTLTMGPAWLIDQVNGDPSVVVSASPAAVAGYPTISLPIGLVSGLPVGVSFVGRPFGEASLLRVAAGLEDVLGLVLRPGFAPTVPLRR